MMPFMTFPLSSGLLIVSLYRHDRKMKVHTAGRRDAQAKARITVLKSLGCFLVLYMVYTLASPFSISSKTFPADLITLFISETLIAACPSLHSVILIMGNPRMKQTCQRILRKTVCAWRAQGLWAGERGVVRSLFWDKFLIALPKRTDLKIFPSLKFFFILYWSIVD